MAVRRTAALTAVMLFVSITAFAQTPPPQAAPTDAPGVAVVGVPIPISNEAIGWGLGGVVGVIVPTGAPKLKLPPSIFGGGGGYTSSGTWLAFGGGQWHVGEDRARIAGGYAHAELHYRLYGTGTEAGNEGQSIPIFQPADAAIAEGLVRTVAHIFVGARYVNLDSHVSLDDEATLPPPIHDDLIDPARRIDIKSHEIKAHVLRDTRNDQFWATSGSQIDFMAGAVRFDALDRGDWFQKYEASGNWYSRLGSKGVIATRAMICGVDGDRVPFYQLCQYGLGADLRGYEAGRYRDRLMSAAQAEYRFEWIPRLGFVAFGGVGEVAPDWSGWTTDNLLPAGGVGLRLSLSKQYRVNYRIDYAYGKNGGQLIIGLGEAF